MLSYQWISHEPFQEIQESPSILEICEHILNWRLPALQKNKMERKWEVILTADTPFKRKEAFFILLKFTVFITKGKKRILQFWEGASFYKWSISFPCTLSSSHCFLRHWACWFSYLLQCRYFNTLEKQIKLDILEDFFLKKCSILTTTKPESGPYTCKGRRENRKSSSNSWTKLLLFHSEALLKPTELNRSFSSGFNGLWVKPSVSSWNLLSKWVNQSTQRLTFQLIFWNHPLSPPAIYAFTWGKKKQSN